MIINDPLVIKVIEPFKASSQGGFFHVDALEFAPPKPKMARDLFKLKRYFNQISREVALFAMKASGEKPLSLEAGEETKSLHEDYADDSPKKDEKINGIKEAVNGFKQALTVTDVDLFEMTNDFGKMVTAYHLCTVKGKAENSEEERSALLTDSMWRDQVGIDDRVEAVIRYCCFFGLTSSLGK
jgi:hypothetical protein